MKTTIILSALSVIAAIIGHQNGLFAFYSNYAISRCYVQMDGTITSQKDVIIVRASSPSQATAEAKPIEAHRRMKFRRKQDNPKWLAEINESIRESVRKSLERDNLGNWGIYDIHRL
jgi:hypothetical protein